MDAYIPATVGLDVEAVNYTVTNTIAGTPVTVANATQKYQIFVGTYETTITYSVASNPA